MDLSSNQQATESEWNTLPSFPFVGCSIQCWINRNEFLVIPCRRNGSDKYNGDGIYKFNIKTKQWTKIIPFPDDFECVSRSIANDPTSDTIYISAISHYYKLTQINLKTKSIKVFESEDLAPASQLCHINGAIHHIGIDRNKGIKHCEWNIKDNELKDKNE